AWAKLLPAAAVEEDEAVATLGPEAWPRPALEQFVKLIDQPRHLHPLLRHQRDIAGIGRSWGWRWRGWSISFTNSAKSGGGQASGPSVETISSPPTSQVSSSFPQAACLVPNSRS